MPSMDRRKSEAVIRRNVVGHGDEETADRGEGLGVTENFLPLARFGENFRKPRHGGNELDANPDKHEAPEEQKLGKVVGERARRERSERVEQDGEGQHPAATELVREVSPDQTEDPASNGRHEEEHPRPGDVIHSSRGPRLTSLRRRHPGSDEFLNLRRTQGGDGRLDDEGQHQQLIDVEREPDGGDDTNQPLSGSELQKRRGRRGGHGSGEGR